MANQSKLRVPVSSMTTIGQECLFAFVGPNQNGFYADKAHIVARSDFFAGAMRGDWHGAKNNYVVLDDVPPALFQRYLHLLYNSEVAVSHPPQSSRAITVATASTVTLNTQIAAPDQVLVHNINGEYEGACALYAFCERMMDVKGKNLVMAAIVEAVHEIRLDTLVWLPSGTAITTIYQGTPKTNPMRRFLVDVYLHSGDPGCLAHGEFPPDFMSEVARGLVGRVLPKDTVNTADATKYMEDKVEEARNITDPYYRQQAGLN